MKDSMKNEGYFEKTENFKTIIMKNILNKNQSDSSRRAFLRSTGLFAAGALLVPPVLSAAGPSPIEGGPALTGGGSATVPAVLGGNPIRTKGWPGWPIWNKDTDEKIVVDDLRSGIWSRASLVNQFEKEWAGVVGTKRCLSVVNGTNALIASLLQMDIGGGDEVIVPPYTFIATVAAVLATGAMPVFVDIDPATFQIDPAKIDAKITSRTRAIMPV